MDVDDRNVAPPSSTSPEIVGYRDALSPIPDAVRDHFIVPLAFGLKRIATHGETVSGSTGCVAEALRNVDEANRQAADPAR